MAAPTEWSGCTRGSIAGSDSTLPQQDAGFLLSDEEVRKPAWCIVVDLQQCKLS